MKKKRNKKDIFRAKSERHQRAKKKSAREIQKRVSQKKGRQSYLYLEGRFSGTKSGFGFVSDEENKQNPDVFIPASKTRGAMDGDLVLVKYKKFSDKKTEGEVIEVIRHFRETIVGRIEKEIIGFHRQKQRSVFVLAPDDKRISLKVNLNLSREDRVGDKVEVMLPKKRTSNVITGEIIRNFGSSETKEANYGAILAECEIPVEFSEEALQNAEDVASVPISEQGRKRLDREIIFTIDGRGAKDLDDAISLSRLPNGRWLLGVHIADVSHYVAPKTPLDREVMQRGTSVYFVDKVIPMLPTVLSNGVCSLNAGEEKYAMSAHITLSQDGKIENCRIEKTIIKSRVRGVYSEVNSLFESGKSSPFYKKYKEVYETLQKMYILYEVLAKKRKQNGTLELESSEAEIILGENGEPISISKSERGDAEKLIEEFMLTANEAVATLLYKKEYPCVYRIHEPPPSDKLENFISYSSNLGLDVRNLRKDNPTAKELSLVLDEANSKGIGSALSNVMLRTMSKARYSDVSSSHYGLGIELYCHFTSPIRRLSDLATHRIIAAVLLNGEEARKYKSYAKRAAVAASESELRALNAERQIEALYKTIYMSRFLSEEFDCVVTSVTKFGLFAQLENTCEGLIPIHSLDGYFIYDEQYKTLSNGAKTYRIGDKLRIRVDSADISSRTVTFSIAKE